MWDSLFQPKSKQCPVTWQSDQTSLIAVQRKSWQGRSGQLILEWIVSSAACVFESAPIEITESKFQSGGQTLQYPVHVSEVRWLENTDPPAPTQTNAQPASLRGSQVTFWHQKGLPFSKVALTKQRPYPRNCRAPWWHRSNLAHWQQKTGNHHQ